LQEKLEKLKTKQFPLLYHKLAKSKFTTVAIEVSQALCLLVSLFIPYEYKATLALFMKSNKGYYVSQKHLLALIIHRKPTIFLQKEWEWTHLKTKYGPTLMVLKNRLTTVLKKSKSYCVGKTKIPIQLFIVW
jgi:hypothetical protein